MNDKNEETEKTTSELPTEEDSLTKESPIVALGALAGGLRALEEFFEKADR